MTFTEIKNKCAAICRNHNIGEYTSQEETNFLNAFFRSHHPDWFIKTLGENVIKYQIRDSGSHGTNCLFLITASNKTTDIGISKCKKKILCDDAYKDNNIRDACRDAGSPDKVRGKN